MRTRLLDAMERTCSWIDFLPDWTWRVPFGAIHWLGCPHGLAEWAFELADRWGVEWGKPGDSCPDCDEPHPWTHDDGSDDERPY